MHEARDALEFLLGKKVPQEPVQGFATELRTHGNVPTACGACRLRHRSRNQRERHAFSGREFHRQRLSAVQQMVERIDDRLLTLLQYHVRHATEEVLDVLLFLGLRQVLRETDDNRIVAANSTRMLVSRPFNPVPEGAFRFHGDRKAYDPDGGRGSCILETMFHSSI